MMSKFGVTATVRCRSGGGAMAAERSSSDIITGAPSASRRRDLELEENNVVRRSQKRVNSLNQKRVGGQLHVL